MNLFFGSIDWGKEWVVWHHWSSLSSSITFKMYSTNSNTNHRLIFRLKNVYTLIVGVSTQVRWNKILKIEKIYVRIEYLEYYLSRHHLHIYKLLGEKKYIWYHEVRWTRIDRGTAVIHMFAVGSWNKKASYGIKIKLITSQLLLIYDVVMIRSYSFLSRTFHIFSRRSVMNIRRTMNWNMKIQYNTSLTDPTLHRNACW